MKARKLEMQCQEKQHITRGKILPTVALFGALLGSPSESYAQSMHNVDDGKTTMEIVQKDCIPTEMGVATSSGIEVLKDDSATIDIDGSDSKEKGEGKGEKSGIDVHGMVQVGSGIAGDYAEVCTDKAALTAVLDVTHKKTGLGVTVVRLDDFHDDPARPASRVTVLNPHWSKTFGKDGQGHVSLEGKYAFIDHLPEASGFSPDIVGSYTLKSGWMFEGMFGHRFQKGADSDAFRLSVSKKMGEAMRLTAQGWYETGCDKHFYGRFLVDIDLGDGFGIQLTCIAKDGKLIPTVGVMYMF